MCRRGAALLELVMVLFGILLIAALAVPILSRSNGNRAAVRAGAQVRVFGQALLMWGADHRGSMPLPSVLDARNATVASIGRAKDTSANIVSVLLFNQLTVPELMVSPQESNPNIQVDFDYAYSSPRGAVRPSEALWDPGFSADFTAVTPGNLSFAHMQPAGTGRFAKWSTGALNAGSVIAGARGPETVGVSGTAQSPEAVFANPRSHTLLNGPWRGTVVFGDGHAEFLDAPFSERHQRTESGVEFVDALFLDEPIDTNGSNDYLGIFTTAGPMPADFRAIWD